jgi:hypothetical protein
MSAAVSADDEESQNRQHADSDEQRRMVGLVHLVVFGEDALLAAVLVFSATLAVMLYSSRLATC